MTSIAQRQACGVQCRGELVILKLGSFERTLTFELALMLAAALLVEGRWARRTRDVLLPTFRVGALLTDATPKKRSAKRFTSALPARLRQRDIAVTHVGTVVHLRIGRTTCGLHFDNALQLSLWLRLRGKQARNAAGESAHWSKIGKLDAALTGDHL